MKDISADHVTVAGEKWQALIPVSFDAIPDLFWAQHAYTQACDGWHPPGPCPPSQWPVRVKPEVAP